MAIHEPHQELHHQAGKAIDAIADNDMMEAEACLH